MSYKSFPKPVRLLVRNAGSAIITNAWEAVESLSTWPERGSREYRIALQHCRDALDGLRPEGHAYRSFTAAASKAGILV
ncbi:DUF982 domain-containing protein [Pararhizobium sp.]|uniref:DUF982 domain-containing protein n=1 Tax=Pararhizobium sp. TaxID=1977563 RepID=UPI00271B6881|nr:DUF982 domain-containing protein [Pararhizobium sp.]MDO9414689.1 DUF982 domain-containing protein [Pararhizobium sp.]